MTVILEAHRFDKARWISLWWTRQFHVLRIPRKTLPCLHVRRASLPLSSSEFDHLFFPCGFVWSFQFVYDESHLDRLLSWIPSFLPQFPLTSRINTFVTGSSSPVGSFSALRCWYCTWVASSFIFIKIWRCRYYSIAVENYRFGGGLKFSQASLLFI